jgi:hypothetical protein
MRVPIGRMSKDPCVLDRHSDVTTGYRAVRQVAYLHRRAPQPNLEVMVDSLIRSDLLVSYAAAISSSKAVSNGSISNGDNILSIAGRRTEAT